MTTYSHSKNGKHLRNVEVVSVDGTTVTVKATAGKMAGMVYEVEATDLVGFELPATEAAETVATEAPETVATEAAETVATEAAETVATEWVFPVQDRAAKATEWVFPDRSRVTQGYEVTVRPRRRLSAPKGSYRELRSRLQLG